MEYQHLLEKILDHHTKNLPFVIFALPNSDRLQALFQKDAQQHSSERFTENGFVLSPFDPQDQAYFIGEQFSECATCAFPKPDETISPVKAAVKTGQKEHYIRLLGKAIDAIKKRNATKIVLSRKSDFELKNFSIEILADRLFASYKTAFRYIWYHPETGLWCGATPELLVQIENNSFKTMALAGTQPVSNRLPIHWGPKEMDEQQLVTDSIIDSLQRVTSVLKISNPHTHQAGSLLHLRTDITGILKTGKATLHTIAAALHPTPAVCGSPKKFAKEFILENEGYDREFYTGFLGPIHDGGKSASIMVNLRCMKIVEGRARVYIGGGVTIGSQPQEEWEETQNKMQTMLHLLQPML